MKTNKYFFFLALITFFACDDHLVDDVFDSEMSSSALTDSQEAERNGAASSVSVNNTRLDSITGKANELASIHESKSNTQVGEASQNAPLQIPSSPMVSLDGAYDRELLTPFLGYTSDYYRIEGDTPYLWLQDNVGTQGRWNIQNRNGRLDIYRGTGGSNLTLVYNGGNVGIGVTSPSNKLDVAGTIRAEEIIVETGWADFVFDESYKLMSLEDMETYIDDHGHLPDMITESDAQKNGVSLGDTQTRLLQKIEELTLHLIAQNKRIRNLENTKTTCLN